MFSVAFMTRERGPLPPIIVLLSILLQIALHVWLPVASIVPPPWNWIGALIIAAGIGILIGPALAFRRSETSIIPFTESSSLVVDGLYRYTRNPMYVGMLLVLTGVAMLAGSLTPFVVPLLFVPLMNVRVIRHEERMLTDTFGAEYTDYASRVGRWF